MTTPGDVVPVPASPVYSAPPIERGDDDLMAQSRFREINERRARVENPELLRHLRSL